MRLNVILVGAAVAVCMAGGEARAQSPGAAEEKGYVEGVVQSAFGNVTSQSFGVELGISMGPAVHIFGEVGHAGDTAPAELGAAAQLMAGSLSQTQSNVTFIAQQPVTFGVAGLRYRFATESKVEPYVMVGGGIAQVKKDVSFFASGTDVTSTLPQNGIVLGTDLSGSETKPMLSFGVGAVWPAWRNLIVDFQYRYGRVFTSDQGLNLNRAGVGIGVRF
jgi:opacity protein-like surface antigen